MPDASPGPNAHDAEYADRLAATHRDEGAPQVTTDEGKEAAEQPVAVDAG